MYVHSMTHAENCIRLNICIKIFHVIYGASHLIKRLLFFLDETALSEYCGLILPIVSIRAILIICMNVLLLDDFILKQVCLIFPLLYIGDCLKQCMDYSLIFAVKLIFGSAVFYLSDFT